MTEKDLVGTISELLASNQYKEAFDAINDNKYSTSVKDKSWDLIPVIVSHLNDENLKNCELFECCEGLLRIITEKSSPEEVLLELIERIELAKDDTQFIAVTKALHQVLLKLLGKRGRSLEWALGAIQTRISLLPIPGEHLLEGEETLALDGDEIVNRITSIYEQILPLYEPLVIEVEKGARRDILASFLLQLLGRPLSCLDLEIPGSGIKNCARRCAEKIVNYLIRLLPDCVKLLDYIKDKQNDSECEDFFSKIPPVSISVFFYLVLSESLKFNFPNVYSPLYIVQSTLNCVVSLLKQREQFVMRKGVLLAHAIICTELRAKIFPSEALDSSVHANFCTSLLNVMVYSDLRECRTLAAQVFRKYLFKWDSRGRYLITWNLLLKDNEVCASVNARAYIIQQYKQMIHEAVPCTENRACEYFSGIKLIRVLDQICVLPLGRETDLMEHGDEIMAALNLLTFIALRDSYNITNIWHEFSRLKNSYLSPLQQAVDISRAHYELRMREVRDEKDSGKITQVNIPGHGTLPQPNAEEQIAVLNSAINSFDALEMLLARLREIIDEPPVEISL